MATFWLFIGFVMEIVGLGCAAVGLWRTWHDNADGRPFFPPRVRAASRWMSRHILKRSPAAITGQIVGVLPALGFEAAGHVSQGLNDSMTVDAKIEAVQSNALHALDRATSAGQAVEQERRERERAIEEVLARLDGAERSMTDYTKGLLVEGIPLAVGGLAAATVGLIIQTVVALI